jgi:hypothetical protein
MVNVNANEPILVLYNTLDCINLVATEKRNLETVKVKHSISLFDHSTCFCLGPLSVFFAPTRYRVVKIMCSYSEVLLRTTNYEAHYDLSWFKPLL